MSAPSSGVAPSAEPLSAGRRAVLVVGGVLALTAVAWGAYGIISLFTGWTSATERIVLTPQQPVLRVEVTSGDVTLHRGTGPDVVVDRRTQSGLRSPETTEVSEPGGVRIEGSCSGPINWFCGVSYDIAVPDGLAVEVVSSSGDLAVRDLTARTVRLEASSGKLRVANLTGALDMQTSSGDIQTEGLRSDTVTAKASSGDVLLEFGAPPSRVQAEASSGDVDVRLPDGVYRVSTETSSGDERVDVATDPGAQRTVDARTSSGDVTVARQDGSPARR